jgi:hypothetical protein
LVEKKKVNTFALSKRGKMEEGGDGDHCGSQVQEAVGRK